MSLVGRSERTSQQDESGGSIQEATNLAGKIQSINPVLQILNGKYLLSGELL